MEYLHECLCESGVRKDYRLLFHYLALEGATKHSVCLLDVCNVNYSLFRPRKKLNKRLNYNSHCVVDFEMTNRKKHCFATGEELLLKVCA